MNRKGETNIAFTLIIIVIAVIALFYIFGATDSNEGDIVNGWWSETTGECWSTSDRPPGVSYPIEETQSTMFQCCFDKQGFQVDCNNAANKLGQKQIGAPFALYGEVSPGIEGYFAVSHGITISNTGNIDLSKVWIESATWIGGNTTQQAIINIAYSQVVGIDSVYAVPLQVGFATDFPTSTIDLQVIGGLVGEGILYELSLVSKASATGLPDASKTTLTTMYVEKEGIGFSIDINIGA